MEEQTENKSAYGKRPLWQWILLYVVIGGLVYAGIYFAFLHKGNNQYSYSNKSTSATKPTSQPTQAQNGVYKMMSKDKLGVVMTDLKGMTLYTFAKDTTGVSNCTGKCLTNWPAYVAPSKTGTFPANISVITRPDDTLQYAWEGMPLYYFVKDGDSGDTYGNGVGGVWSVIKL